MNVKCFVLRLSKNFNLAQMYAKWLLIVGFQRVRCFVVQFSSEALIGLVKAFWVDVGNCQDRYVGVPARGG